MVWFTIYSSLIINFKIFKFVVNQPLLFQSLIRHHWHYLKILNAILIYPILQHPLPLLHHIHIKIHFHDFDNYHHVLIFNQLFLGILIAMNLFQILNQLLIPAQLVLFILKIRTLHLVPEHFLSVHHNFEP